MARLLDTEGILQKDSTLLHSLAFVEALPGVRGVAKGKWIKLPHSRLRGGTVVPLGTDNGNLLGKLYTKIPDTGYIPLTIYTLPKIDPEQISQLIAARNFQEAERVKADRATEDGPDPILQEKWGNRPRVEIAQTQKEAKRPEPEPETACPLPSASATIPPLRTKRVTANALSKPATVKGFATTTPPPLMRSNSRREIPAGMVDLTGAMKILDLGNKSSVNYHVKMGHLKPAIIGRRGMSHLYRVEDVKAFKATMKGPGAPPGGHAPRVLHTVEDKLDRMIDLLATVTKQQAALLEKWQ